MCLNSLIKGSYVYCNSCKKPIYTLTKDVKSFEPIKSKDFFIYGTTESPKSNSAMECIHCGCQFRTMYIKGNYAITG